MARAKSQQREDISVNVITGLVGMRENNDKQVKEQKVEQIFGFNGFSQDFLVKPVKNLHEGS